MRSGEILALAFAFALLVPFPQAHPSKPFVFFAFKILFSKTA
jgi:hypothetical protein